MIGQSQSPIPARRTEFTRNKYDAPSGIRTHNPNKRAATDPHLWWRGNRYRSFGKICLKELEIKSSNKKKSSFFINHKFVDLFTTSALIRLLSHSVFQSHSVTVLSSVLIVQSCLVPCLQTKTVYAFLTSVHAARCVCFTFRDLVERTILGCMTTGSCAKLMQKHCTPRISNFLSQIFSF
jgi:hypothetical protein